MYQFHCVLFQQNFINKTMYVKFLLLYNPLPQFQHTMIVTYNACNSTQNDNGN